MTPPRRLRLEPLEPRALLTGATLVPSGLIHQWRLDEAQGGIAYDAVGSADGTLVDLQADAWTDGRLGGALDFNGMDGHVSVGQVASLQRTGSITVSAWVNVERYYDWSGIAGWLHDTGTTESGYVLMANGADGLGFGLKTVNGGFSYLIDDGNPTGQWIHVAGTYNGTWQKLYINGQLAGQTAMTGAIDWDPLGDDGFEIGRYHDDNEDFTFAGLIDEVRVYNRAITGAEVTILAAEPPSANHAPVAMSDSAFVPGSGASTIHVLGNDRDADDDALAIGSFTQPQHGLLVDGGDGTLVFTPNA
ncbi:MAG: Ig-like domain-containing protein, partial [Planctomycetia bacterium]|nr:Ig-like domain-containing protein [Planctomycetia bacterium]